jgi:choline-glycine betaine transporter
MLIVAALVAGFWPGAFNAYVQATLSRMVPQAGGLEALQGMIAIAALPFALPMLLVVLGLYRALDLQPRLQARRAQKLRQRMLEWMEREDAARNSPGRTKPFPDSFGCDARSGKRWLNERARAHV